MNTPKVYIIIINYGTPHDTIESLESIIINNYQFFQVLIIDVANLNNSVEKITGWIEQNKDSRFTLLSEKQNKGFSYANNIGINYALSQKDAGFIWVLNNDTVISKHSLKALISCYNKHKSTSKTGFIGSKIMDYKNRSLIQNVGGTFNKWTGYSTLLGMGETDKKQYDRNLYSIDYVVGASMFFHVSLVEEIGLMPENYFLYYEDIDWSITAKRKGFTNITCIDSVIFHKQGLSTGSKLLTETSNLDIKKHLYLSYLIFYRRHYKWLIPIAYFILIKQWAGKVIHNNMAEAGVILKVILNKS